MGKMEIVFDKNTTITKEEFIIKALEEELKEDRTKNDTKSIMYHSLALEEHKKYLEKLKNKTSDLEISL